MITSMCIDGQERHVFSQVCPDYGLTDGISKEAEAGIRAAKALDDIFGSQLVQHILVADTEYDLPEVVARIGGTIDGYKRICGVSVDAIAGQLSEVAEVQTFSQYFSDGFHDRQYLFEDIARNRMVLDGDFAEFIQRMSIERADKHMRILGRPEQDNELAIRYIAQYAAFGNLMRENYSSDQILLVNYPTPNRQFYNGLGNTTTLSVLGSVISNERL